MRRLALPAAAPWLVAAALLAGCDKNPRPSPPDATSAAAASSAAPVATAAPAKLPVVDPRHEGGALTRAPDEDVLYVADEDHKVVRRVPLPLDAQRAVAVPMPGAPAQVLALPGRVLVTVRDPGLLLILEPDKTDPSTLVQAAKVALPADAWGIAVTPDEKTALVTSAWTHKLSAVDLGARAVKWSIDVPREPRAVVVRPDGQGAYVTHLVGSSITRVDDLAGTPRAHAVELPPAPARAPSAKTLNASLAYAAVLDEGRLFVPRHALGALGQGSWFGATTVDVLAVANDTPVLPKRLPGVPMAKHALIAKMIDAGLATNLDTSGQDVAPILQPRAVVLRRRTRTLLVAGEGDDRVAEVDTLSVAPMMRPLAIYKVGSGYDGRLPVASACGAPAGLALSRDEARLFVFCRATYDIAEVELVDPERPPPVSGSPDAGTPAVPAKVTHVHLADDLLGKEEALGRRLFYNATDPVMSGGLGCAGCHPEGRDDGHVWHESKVTSQNESERVIFIAEPELAPNEKNGKSGYAKQTPMLAGRVASPGPYGWHAQNRDLVARLEEGFGLHRWNSIYPNGEGEQLARIQYLRAFLQHGLVTPPREDREMSADEKKGKEIFMSERARCAKCHTPETDYTDRIAYPFTPKAAAPPGFEDDPKSEYRTPSLRFVGGTPPYFHDGRYGSLEELIDKNDDRMGRTNHLSHDERNALIAFLRTL